jgi:hypothetical protein
MIARLLEWLGQLLLVLFVVRLVARLFSGGRQPSRSGASSSPGSGGERAGGTLVRDPQCGTYVPTSRALRVGHGDSAVYFCSTTCRDAYAAAHGH